MGAAKFNVDSLHVHAYLNDPMKSIFKIIKTFLINVNGLFFQ